MLLITAHDGQSTSKQNKNVVLKRLTERRKEPVSFAFFFQGPDRDRALLCRAKRSWKASSSNMCWGSLLFLPFSEDLVSKQRKIDTKTPQYVSRACSISYSAWSSYLWALACTGYRVPARSLACTDYCVSCYQFCHKLVTWLQRLIALVSNYLCR